MPLEESSIICIHYSGFFIMKCLSYSLHIFVIWIHGFIPYVFNTCITSKSCDFEIVLIWNAFPLFLIPNIGCNSNIHMHDPWWILLYLAVSAWTVCIVGYAFIKFKRCFGQHCKYTCMGVECLFQFCRWNCICVGCFPHYCRKPPMFVGVKFLNSRRIPFRWNWCAIT